MTAWTKAVNKILHYAWTLSHDSDAPFRLKGRKKEVVTERRRIKRTKARRLGSEKHVKEDKTKMLYLLGYESKVLFVVHDGLFDHASSDHAATPAGKRITQALLRLGHTVCSADEFRMTMFCSKYHHKTRSIPQSDDHVQCHLDHLKK
eukprot:CAMPEP_0175039856 /NCGR_PEP_ID=MMETSP0052_2-20121109/878_1 /TAXON_ID=51329 ORGANISM="Polytomella parva, Strain SAG 63-3" /NCGR_SAMPLE_ID=MMETSP0052_2 /ASSEMBLY_ACC=CAM_ASM_000194 /LENGTH=147 /DNA_ID=CAMNT_0016301879 /DNA_START=1317 /DNA_END=1760 /DNA_ORIENTATION=-